MSTFLINFIIKKRDFGVVMIFLKSMGYLFFDLNLLRPYLDKLLSNNNFELKCILNSFLFVRKASFNNFKFNSNYFKHISIL